MSKDRYQIYKETVDLDEHSRLKGFYKAGLDTSIYVSRDGQVWSERKNRLLYVHYTTNGYPTVRVDGKNVYLHRLLASTFLVRPKIDAVFQVNHIDGNKHNHKLENLEWVTPSRNLSHAYETALRSEPDAVKLKDIRTGEIFEFSSIGKCANYLSKSPSSVYYYLIKDRETPYLGRYELRYKNDSWKGFTEKDLDVWVKGSPRAIVVKELATGLVSIYSSSTEASRVLGINRPRISEKASSEDNRVAEGYEFTWLDQVKLKQPTRPFT